MRVDELFSHAAQEKLRSLEAEQRKKLASQIEAERAKLQESYAKKLEAEKELAVRKLKADIEQAKIEERNKLEAEQLAQREQYIQLQKQLHEQKLVEQKRRQELELQISKIKEQTNKELQERLQSIEERHQREIAEKQKQLDRIQSASKTTSQELQGEAQEDAVLLSLRAWFPTDDVTEVKKGHSGADIIQSVRDISGELGTIVYEVKNTKSFSSDWIEKLRKDMIAQKGQLGVLVSEALPAAAEKQHGYLGIEGDTLFVCKPRELPVVAKMARILIKDAAKNLSNRASITDKKDLIWQTVNSPKFRQTLLQLDNYFKRMRDDLDKHNKHNNLYYKHQTKRLEALVLGLQEIESGFLVHLPDGAMPLLEGEDLNEGDLD